MAVPPGHAGRHAAASSDVPVLVQYRDSLRPAPAATKPPPALFDRLRQAYAGCPCIALAHRTRTASNVPPNPPGALPDAAAARSEVGEMTEALPALPYLAPWYRL